MEVTTSTVVRELLRRLNRYEKECIRRSRKRIPYSEIATELKIGPDEARRYVISGARKLGISRYYAGDFLDQLETWDKGGKEAALKDNEYHIKASGLLKKNKERLRTSPETLLLKSRLDSARNRGYNDGNIFAEDDYYGDYDYSVYYEPYDGEFVEEKITDDEVKKPVEERLALLDDFIDNHPGLRISDYARRLFPELAELALQEEAAESIRPIPESPPDEWEEDRERGESPASFTKRVYGEWIGKGLTKPVLRRLDPKLYQALATWERRHPEDKLDLPTRADIYGSWTSRVAGGEPNEASSQDGVSVEAQARELERRAKALRRSAARDQDRSE